MVWDTYTQNHRKIFADEQEYAMEFRARTIAAFGVSKDQRQIMLVQAMDLNILVWTISLCLALQRCRGDHLLSLEAENFRQGAQQSTFVKKGIKAMVKEIKRISRFK